MFAGGADGIYEIHSSTRIGCGGNEGKDSVNWRPHWGVMNIESGKTLYGSGMQGKEANVGCAEGIKWGS